MSNSFINAMDKQQNVKLTENGAVAYRSTFDKLYDMFALGGAYRTRLDEDIIFLFQQALEENEAYAMKCLFYLRDIIGGQGERRFFRVAFRWLCDAHPELAKRNLNYISEFGRWDDLIYACEGTKLEVNAFTIVAKQIVLDLKCKTPSLLAKWMPSENASSKETTRVANKLRQFMKLSHKDYRKVLSSLRERINIVERLMSSNQWDKIEFDKIPSKAGMIYKNAFARRDLIAQKYKEFMQDDTTKVNAKALFPYEIVQQALGYCWHHNMWADNISQFDSFNNPERLAINKYWENLPDYFDGSDRSILAVVDTSGSMYGNPINVAISLGIYAGEHSNGAFKNHYISFASIPQLITIEGVDFVDKVKRIYDTNLCDNTNLPAVFDMLLRMMLSGEADPKDLPSTIVVISDMEIDSATYDYRHRGSAMTRYNIESEMETIRRRWNNYGYKMPSLIYWNVNARNNTFIDAGPDVSFVSGCSPILFEQVVKGITGKQLMMDKLNSKRYENIH